MLRPPPRANGQPAPAPDMAGIPVGTYHYNPAAPGQPAVTFEMNGETVDFIPMMLSQTARRGLITDLPSTPLIWDRPNAD